MPQQTMTTTDLSTRILRGYWLSRAVWVAARLRLADAVGDGPADPADVACAAGVDPDALTRVLHALASAGVFEIDDAGHVWPTADSNALRSDDPRSQRTLLDHLLGDENHASWGELAETVRTGRTGFDLHYGHTWIEHYAAHPAAGRRFAEAMSATTANFEEALMAADPFPRFAVAVDVGGSHGSLLRRLLARDPAARGVVFDLPEVVAQVEDEDLGADLDGRLAAVAGDFFDAVPPGADLYLLKLILHDWDDEHAVAILRTVRAAAPEGARVAIVEAVLPERPDDHAGWWWDLQMLVMTGGRERSRDAYAALLQAAGWRLERVVDTASPLSVVLAV